MEKIRLVSMAVGAGISESLANEILAEESLIDFSLDQLKQQIKERQ